MNQLFNLVAAKDLTSGQVATHLSTLRSSEQLRGIVELDLPETVPPTSFSINFGGSGGVFFGLALLQSITFDLHEWQPGSGKAIYTGSTSIGGSVGVELGVSAGGSVSANWFRAQDAGGWYVGSGGGFVAVGGVTAAYASTSAGIALTFGLAGGLNIGVSIDGGYTLLEGQGTYDLRGGPSVPPAGPPRAMARRVKLQDHSITFPSGSREKIFKCFTRLKAPPNTSWGGFGVFEWSQPGTVPVYEYVLSVLDAAGTPAQVYFYSIQPKPGGFAAPAAPAFYVPAAEYPGQTRPVHMYVKMLDGIQLYWYTLVGPGTVDGDMPPGYTYSGVAFQGYDV